MRRKPGTQAIGIRLQPNPVPGKTEDKVGCVDQPDGEGQHLGNNLGGKSQRVGETQGKVREWRDLGKVRSRSLGKGLELES